MRPLIFAGASFILSLALQLTMAKYGADVPDWGLLILWVLPLAPFGWWLWTHDKVLSRRDKLKRYFQLHPWRSIGVSIATLLIVMGCLGGIGYTGWKIVKAEKSKSPKPELSHEQATVSVKSSTPTQENHPPISTARGIRGTPITPATLLDLFKKDFTGVASLSGKGFDLQDANGQVGAHVDWRVLTDFTAKSWFIAFYVPAVRDEVPVCLALIDKVQPIMDDLLHHLDASGGFTGESTSLSELTFSGRVFICHEWPLSNKQKADILEAYSTKGMDVQFRGVDYLSSHSATSAKTPTPAESSPIKPQQDNSVHIGTGANVDQTSKGPCSPNIIGGSNTVNCGPSPAKLVEFKVDDFIDRDEEGKIVPSRYKYNKQVTVTVDGSYTPVSIAVMCDAPISEVAGSIKQMDVIQENSLDTVSTDGNSALVYFEGTPATPDHPITVVIRSNSQFSVLRVVKWKEKAN